MSAGSFARSVLVLAAGGAVGQLIGVLASPAITRLYVPADIGTLSVYTSLLSLLAVVVSLRYEQAIPMPSRHGDAQNLLAVALAANLSLSLGAAVLVAILGAQIAVWTQSPGLMPGLWLLPVSLAALGAFEALSLWAVRIREFSLIARGKVSQNIGQVVAQISFGLAGLGPVGLIIGDAASRLAAGAVLGHLLASRGMLIQGVSRAGMRTAATQFRRFAAVSSISAIVNATVGNLPPLMLAVLYGPAVAGLYALGRLVIVGPVGLVGQSIARVYLSRVTRARHEAPGTLMGIQLRVTARLLLSIPGFILLFVAAPVIFPLIFGPSWADVGTYVQILCPALAFDFIFLPTNALTALGFVGRMLAWDIFRMVTALGGILVAHAAGAAPEVAILAYSVALCLSFTLLFLMNIAVIRRHFPVDAPAS